jgi:hypothetical protein
LAKLKCPNCDAEKVKSKIAGLKSLYGFGFEYVCTACHSTVVHPPFGQFIFTLSFLPLIVMNWPGLSLIYNHPYIALGLFVLSLALMFIGSKKMKPHAIN